LTRPNGPSHSHRSQERTQLKVMHSQAHQKVQAEHLRRQALLYVRQSTMRQVQENQESAKRQYGLRERALALGWPAEQIVVIDCDQGLSAGSAVEREGFQKLVTEVSMNRAGIVMGLEVSRLARNSSDWHRLLEICALTRTLLLDDDGLYDPAHFNDRLLLGLKGTMSEAELYVIRSRLRGGLLQKARRGELRGRLPTGLACGANGQVELDPDRQVRESFQHLFGTFERTGSAVGGVKAFHQEGLKFPCRVFHGPEQGELVWEKLTYSRVAWILNCPRYAGAYVYGRSRSQKLPSGRIRRTKKKLPPDQWYAFIPNTHAGYISWEQFQANQQKLRENATASRCQRERTPPREGPALLQGLAICGQCGRHMQVGYCHQRGQLYPHYVCGTGPSRPGLKFCQYIAGRTVDQAISDLLLQTVTPLNVEVALAVQQELQTRYEEVDRLRQQTLQRAHQEAQLARRRYLQVNPDNRLVADQLEADWNGKLGALRGLEAEYQKQKEADQESLSAEQRQRVLALAADFPKVWQAPNLSHRDRKRIARLLLEDVTLDKTDKLLLHVRFKGGALQTLELPLPLPHCEVTRTPPEVIAEIDRLLGEHTHEQTLDLLNAHGFRSGTGRQFNLRLLDRICKDSGLKSRRERLRQAGMISLEEMSRRARVTEMKIARWRRAGQLPGYRSNYRNEYLYPPPSPELITKLRKKQRRQNAT
jgi:DNA invertase Pin-like site-specific DNA recombinase